MMKLDWIQVHWTPEQWKNFGYSVMKDFTHGTFFYPKILIHQENLKAKWETQQIITVTDEYNNISICQYIHFVNHTTSDKTSWPQMFSKIVGEQLEFNTDPEFYWKQILVKPLKEYINYRQNIIEAEIEELNNSVEVYMEMSKNQSKSKNQSESYWHYINNEWIKSA